MTALYNEIDPYAADWLENLIAAGHIAPGIVDRRSIVDISQGDLKGFRQVHFFAGIGVWSYALRKAGWPDDRPIWTGSCPCQPFSAAGKGGGFDDERHLWPHFHYLIEQCRPAVVLGEQVASKDGLAWLDLVQSDMEGTGYACGAVDTCSASVGAPHIRQRLRFAAVRMAQPDQGQRGSRRAGAESTRRPLLEPAGPSAFSQLGHAVGDDMGRDDRAAPRTQDESEGGGQVARDRCVVSGPTSAIGQFADASGAGLAERVSVGRVQSGTLGALPRQAVERVSNAGRLVQPNRDGRETRGLAGEAARHGCSVDATGGAGRPRPTNGFWSNPDWLLCRDGKWRPVESGTFPLAHGAPARVGRLRAYGNAVDAEATREFCEAVKDALG